MKAMEGPARYPVLARCLQSAYAGRPRWVTEEWLRRALHSGQVAERERGVIREFFSSIDDWAGADGRDTARIVAEEGLDPAALGRLLRGCGVRNPTVLGRLDRMAATARDGEGGAGAR